jgi:uncharacterized paraquat-inducible protein A
MTMAVLLIILAIISAAAGALYVNNATVGVACLAGACLLAILARIAQADRQHAQLMERLAGREAPAEVDIGGVYCPACNSTAIPKGAFCRKCGQRLPGQ